jgi:hypothetical protein
VVIQCLHIIWNPIERGEVLREAGVRAALAADFDAPASIMTEWPAVLILI